MSAHSLGNFMCVVKIKVGQNKRKKEKEKGWRFQKGVSLTAAAVIRPPPTFFCQAASAAHSRVHK